MRQSLLETIEPIMIDHSSGVWTDTNEYQLRSDARRFEMWENNYAARIGLGVAIDYALVLGLDNIYQRANGLAVTLRNGLKEISGITVHDLGRNPCAIVTFSSASTPSDDIKLALADQNINASVSDVSSTRLDAMSRNLPPIVRLSPHYYNTETEIDVVLNALRGILP
jgi:selenocysteine lyase/cysteine desulfurase